MSVDWRFPSLRLAIVCPVHARGGVAHMARTLRRTWPVHQPCRQQANGLTRATTSLFFYFARGSGRENARLAAKLKSAVALVRDCFRSVEELSAHLEAVEDLPVVGPSHMFYRLFDRHSPLRGRADAFFWYEHDVFPIRPLWLEALLREAMVAGRFWVRGSVIRTARLDQRVRCKLTAALPSQALAVTATRGGRGEELRPMEQRLWEPHINGAALYTLASRSFANATAEARRRFPPSRETDFDVALFVHLADKRFDFAGFRETAHLLQYTEVVQNLPGSDVSFMQPHSPTVDAFRRSNPYTFLVHSNARQGDEAFSCDEWKREAKQNHQEVADS